MQKESWVKKAVEALKRLLARRVHRDSPRRTDKVERRIAPGGDEDATFLARRRDDNVGGES